ncbi:MAG: hypothetical protein MUO76_24295, partial [Anaerolineaceae bacterium]|nr:hypothetical protein [Anaerolineaceae bacterium]
MEKIEEKDFELFFDPQEHGSAELLRVAVEKSFQTIQEHWGLNLPEDLRVYVMTSWQRFIFHSAPWFWKIA